MRRVVVIDEPDEVEGEAPAERRARKTAKQPAEEPPKAVKARATRPNNRRPLEDEFFELNKLLLRYTQRLSRLRRDDRFPKNAPNLAGKFDSDLERMAMIIANVRRDFANSLDPNTKEDDVSGDEGDA